jgi:hypothetical protein
MTEQEYLLTKEFVLTKTKITDDLVSLISTEGVGLRAGVKVNIDGVFRVVGRTKSGRVLASEITADALTHIETSDENLKLVKRNEKKFKKVYAIITKSKQEKRLKEAEGIWD